MKLYTHTFSPNCRKVYAIAKELDIKLEHQTVNLMGGEQRQPDFLRLNPNGKVPVLVDGDTTLWESNAIACYLAGKQDTHLWPKSAQRYDILRWMFWESNHLSKAVSKIIGQKIFNRDNPDQAIIDKGLADFRKCAAVLNSTLESNRCVTGETETIADYIVAVWLGYEQICDLPLDEFGYIRRWSAEIAQTPGGQLLPPPRS